MELKNNELEKEYQRRKEEIQNIINEPIDDSKYSWNETVKRYATTIEQVKKAFLINEMRPHIPKKLIDDMDIFLRRCTTPEFHIALVGAIKAGKSTLINAILGYELASTEVTPETASLTKFKSATEDYIEVVFYTQEEWSTLWKSVTKDSASIFVDEYKNSNAKAEKNKWLGKNKQQYTCKNKDILKKEINKWTSSKSPAHYFVKEVIVGLKDFDLPEGVVLVDTPGLNDVVEYRSNITRDYINRANAVLVCVKSDALTGNELITIYNVFTNTRNNVEKVYIIGTQMDTLNNPIADWNKQKDEWLKYLKDDSCYSNLRLANQKLIGVSAYLYTILKEYKEKQLDEKNPKFRYLRSTFYKLDIDNLKDINKDYEKIKDFTNIEFLKIKLQNEIISKYKQLIIDDIISSYKYCTEDLKEKIIDIKKGQEDIINASQQGIDEVTHKKNEYEAKLNQVLQEKKDLNNLVEELKISTTKRVDELVKAIRDLNKRIK